MEVKELIKRCRQGDADALETLYTTYARRMRGICRRYVSDEQAVSDILHDSFVIIFTSFDKLNDDSKAEGWMMAITRNVALKYADYHESHRTVKLDDTGEAELTVEENQENGVRGIPFSEVMRLVEKLPEGYRRVFRLSVFEGLSHREIADIMGIAPHSSSSQLARAKKMLRKMMRQALIVLLFLFPFLLYLLWKGDDVAPKDEIPMVFNREEKPLYPDHRLDAAGKTQEPANSMLADSPVRHSVVASTDTMQCAMAQIADSLIGDNLSNEIVQEQNYHVLKADTAYSMPKAEISRRYVSDLRSANTGEHNGWHVSMAYAGNLQNEARQTDNYMTMPSFSGGQSRSTKIYNWGEYMDYVMENAPMMDSVSASNMMQMAIVNSNNPSEPISETKHHEPPLTFRVSLSRQLSGHWAMETGLSYLRMKSTFESGNDNTFIHRTQRLHYLGIPLKLSYDMSAAGRWSLYATGGVQLDIPVCTRLTTRYIYTDMYEHIGNSPDIDTSIRAPWRWSVGAGIGLQYRIVSNVSLYMEPSANYYLPTSSDVETYLTEHPFTFSLPVGVRFTW